MEKLFSKQFSELTLTELYEIIKSRAEIFLLEQKIICQDLDDMDYESLHCFFKYGKRVTAYLRAFSMDDETVKVGRVFTLEHKKGLGRNLMNESISEIKRVFNCKKIVVHAQKQAEGFYKKIGFNTVSDEFIEEGIIHVTMEMNI